jgi:hypothetical protein
MNQQVTLTNPYHIHDNSAFKEYVSSKNDIDGMIAYCLYKLKKSEYITSNRFSSEDDLFKFCEEHIRGRKFTENKQEAKEKINLSIKETESKIRTEERKNNVRNNILIGLTTGVISSLVVWFITT